MQAPLPLTDPLQHPRFQILSKLGAGGFGTVYEALDRERGYRVALKRLHRVGAPALVKFRTEFRELSELRHPSLPTLFDLFLHDEQWFFTMDLVVGRRLSEYIATSAEHSISNVPDALTVTEATTHSEMPERAPSARHGAVARPKSVDFAKLRTSLAQLTTVLDYIHQRGRVHCDVKPSNVLVDEAGDIVLLDFGLAQTFGARLSFEGTPGYAAPEQILREHVGPATDYYALGTMLFESIAGRRPFVGPESQMLLDKVQFDAPSLSTFAPNAPADLVATCAQWLSRDPAARLASRKPPPRAPSPRFVGREKELERLHSAYAAAHRHQHVVVIEGASGIGKSALLRRFLAEVQEHTTPPLVLSGKASDREHVTFNAFDGVAETLKEHAQNPRRSDSIRELGALFPTLRAPDGELRTDSTREKGFDALSRILDSTEGEPAILWLDDTQWADMDSQALLRALCTAPSPARCLILLTKRPGPTTLDVPVRTEQWQLPPLSVADAEALAAEWAKDDTKDANALSRIALASAGLPLFIEELSRAPSRDALPPSVEASILARAATLAPGVRLVLEIVCLSGAALSESDIAAAAGVSRQECSHILEQLRYERLVSTERIAGTRGYRPYHDRIRDVIVETLTKASRSASHVRIANVLEHAPNHSVALFADHLVLAGDLQRAAAVVLVAAQSAESVFAYEQAARLYEKALALKLPVGLPRPTLLERRANALEKAHLSAEAAEAYLTLSEFATTERERSAHLERACRLFLWSGELERGMGALDALFQRLGERLPKSQLAALVELAWHYFVPHLRSPHDAAPDDHRFLLLRSAAQGLGMIDNLRGALLHARAFRIGQAIPDRERSAEALALEAIFSGCSGELGRRRARTLLNRIDALFAPGPLSSRATAWRNAAATVTEMQRTPTFDVAERLKACEDRFLDLRDGDAWAVSSLRLIRALTLRIVGDLPTLRTFVPEILRDAERRNDRYAYSTIGRGSVILWKADDTPDLGHAELGRLTWPSLPGSFHFQEWVGLEGAAELALYEGTAPAFVKAHRRELWALRTAPFNMLVQSVRVLVLTLLGKLELARYERGERACEWTARYYAARLLMEGVAYATIRGEILSAGILAADRRWKRSALHLVRATQLAERAGYPYLGGVSAYLLGKLDAAGHTMRDTSQARSFSSDSLSRVGVRRPDLVSRSEAPGFQLIF